MSGYDPGCTLSCDQGQDVKEPLPIAKADFLALLADARIPSDARIMAMLILELGDGWHEISHEQFGALLDGPSDETIRRHLRKLEHAGWIESKKNTGRRAPQYRFRSRSEAGAFGGFRDALLAALPEALAHTHEGQKPLPHTHEGETHGSAPHPRGAEAVCPTPTRGREPPSSSSCIPPPPPPPTRARAREAEHLLSIEAERAIEKSGDVLNGCRDSLRDYLRMRVEPGLQYGYVQRVVTSLEGGADEWIWRDKYSGQTLREGRTAILAAAFNELAAGDETGPYFPDPPGGWGNLRSKVRYLVGARFGAERDAKRKEKRDGDGAGATGETRAQSAARGRGPIVQVLE